jgi:catalase
MMSNHKQNGRKRNGQGALPQVNADSKDADLAKVTTKDDTPLTTNQGQRVGDDQNSLRAGSRGPTLLEDYILREKLQHFDHERIPERVVHARGAAAHGYFELYESLEKYTIAKVLTDTATQTPLFVRFSTVAGSRGSADTARDVRGFAVKMYTADGNWDLVGNNIPVFFIQDAIKFPDLIHAVKPEPNNEIPQAASAHDTFYDFISLTPESMHMLMWIMSDRAIPRSYRMMDGFGVHTFRLINAAGEAHFVKFHWKPVLGAHSLVWDEAVKIAGQDADFHRRDLWESIEKGDYPEWELALQIMPEADAEQYDFDVLDATKLWPEDLIPLKVVGKMTLNRNPDNYFSETEQVAFMTTNIVPGIDFTDDPLLQGRNFSYLDTQLSRLGSPNFHELPINRPLATISNNQRDAHMRYTINKGRVAYAPASLDGHSPDEVYNQQGFHSYEQRVNGPKVRVRSESFADHYGQARLFWNSMTAVEKKHIIMALQFELSKVDTKAVRQRMLERLAEINDVLAAEVGYALGEKMQGSSQNGAMAMDMEHLANALSPTSASGGVTKTSGLSQEEGQPQTPKGRKVAILAAPGVAAADVELVQKALQAAGATADVIGPHLGPLDGTDGAGSVEATKTYANSGSVQFDAVFVPGGKAGSAALQKNADALLFINEAYKHGKPIGAVGEGVRVVEATPVGQPPKGKSPTTVGLFLDEKSQQQSVTAFVQALAQHRFRNRADQQQVVA